MLMLLRGGKILIIPSMNDESWNMVNSEVNGTGAKRTSKALLEVQSITAAVDHMHSIQ